ncbi:hypothetical protein OGH69_13760 [Flavobacterium sp. MFBS3-15]|uniref:hypothetical protein n=1 Tax=Flavobacterium sp. MFBS3-15 TaxID=2989816 RepID=UPI002236834C|nr:hypothetical protein [Flavobacterium sp. MFBS3-15]MCW4470039.1 hypothetical protein [Flavobacterium sp. MFBS3-15]
MNKVLLLLLCTLSCVSQDIQQKIDALNHIGVLNAFIPTWYLPGSQQQEVNEFAKTLLAGEIEVLAANKNPFVYVYANCWLIASGKGDVVKIFQASLKQRDSVAIMNCGYSYEAVYDKYYDVYTTRLYESLIRDGKEPTEQDIELLFNSDATLHKLDSLIIISKKPVTEFDYFQAFSHKKFDKKLLPKIEKLAFRKHIPHALFYLEKYYPEQYRKRIRDYLHNDFMKAKFVTFDERMKLREYLYYLENGDESMKKLALEKREMHPHIDN